jgi:hypothetical protein
MPFVPALLVAVVVLAAAVPAAAVQTDLTIFLDFDNNAATGCNDPVSGFQGYDQKVVTTVNTTTGPNTAMVTQIEGFDCANAQVFFDGTDHPVGIGNGDLGLNVIETYWPIVSFPPPPTPCHGASHAECLRLGVFASNANGGEDALFTTNGAPDGPAILFLLGGVSDIPTLSQWGLLALILLLAGAAAFKLRRRPLRALLLVLLVLAAGGVAYAIVFDLNGNTLHEWSLGNRIAFDPTAQDDGDDIASLYARTYVPDARVYFRIDASLVFNTPPVVTTSAGATNFTEDGAPVVVDPAITVTDANSANLASATVTITNPQDGALETLAASACAGLTVTPGLNSLTITGSQPPATYQTCLQSVTYNNTDQDPSNVARTVAFTADDGISSSPAANKTVTVTPVNDAPVVTTTAGSTAFTEDGGPVVVDAGVTVSDVDSANLASATVTITNPQDGALEVLAATACGGLTVTPGLNTLGITGSATLATYQTCLQSVTFDDTSNNPSTTNRTISFVVNDGATSSAPANKTVTVAPDPDAPVVTTTAGSTSFTEDGGAVVVDAGVTVTDPDDTNLASATVTVTNVQDGAAEQLNATSCAGLTVGGGGTSTLNISGSQPLATYQACLQSVTYNNTDQDPNNTPRVISFVANDGTNASAPANKTVTVTPANDAPVVTTTAGNTAFTEGGGAVVVDAGVTVTDVDNANLASATVTITNVQDGAAEVLNATACAGLTVGGSGTSTLNISGSQPLATYQTCLQSVTYNNTDQDPNTTNRVISFVANDGTASSAPANKTVTIGVVDNAPVVTTTAGITTFTEDGGAVLVDAGVTVTDADSANLASATVTITNPQDGASEVLAAGACAGIIVTPGVNSLALSGSATVAAYQTCFQSVTYNNGSQNPTDAPNRIVRFVANDGTSNSNNGDKAVDVVPQNDAPVVTTTAGTTAFTEDGGPVVVDAGVTVSDVDNANLASATVTVTNVLDGAAEQLAATACAGLTVGGSGTSTLSISGSQPLATYQTCLQSVTYNNTDQDPNNTTRVISFVANDGALSSTPATKNVSVAPANDAPVVTTTGGSTSFTEGGGAVVVDSGVTVTDVDSPNLALATVSITNVLDPTFESLAAGACAGLTVGGSGTPTLTITGSQPPATYQACLQSVTYNNTDLAPDTTNRVISFVANDGALPSNTANKTVTITAINSAPAVTTTAGTTAFVEDAGPVVVDSGVAVNDVDNPNLASATVSITNVQDVGLEGLAASACGAFTVGGSGTATLTISGSQPLATYQSCLQSVTYNNASNNPNTTTRVVRFVVNDGALNSNNGDKNVSVTGANDAPVVTPTAGNTAFTEDGGPVVVDSGITVLDVDSPNLVSASVTITNPQNGASEVLAANVPATNCPGLTVTPALNSLSITGSASQGTYQTCLRNVTYDNTSQNPTAAPNRIVRFVVNDGALNSNNGDKTVTVTPQNDAPVVTPTAGVTAFVEDAGAVVVDGGITVTDVDSANIASGTVTITNPQDGAVEVLSATACGGITVTPGVNNLTLSGSFPLATYQTCLQSVRYNNSSNNPTAAPNRIVRFVVNDGAANSNNGDKAVSVQAVNDAPVVTTTAGNTSFTEDGPAVVVDSGVTVSDVDNANLASATVTITNVQDVGFEQLAASACGAFTVGGSGTATLTITGSQPLATYQACLQSVTYNNTDQDPAGAPNRIVRFVVNDGTSNSNNGDKTVTVTPVNDAPTVTTTAGSTTFTEDGGAVVVDSGVTVADVDNANLASATVTITNVTDAGSETLAANSPAVNCPGLTVTPGTTLSVSGSATLGTYQNCLRAVTYNNSSQNPTASPSRSISFVVNDGALPSAAAFKTVVVVPVNDAPTCSVNPVTYATAGNTLLEVAGATLPDVAHVTDAQSLLTKAAPTDVDGPPGITVVPVSGNTGGGDWVISSDGSFTFVPNAGFTGTATRTFQVTDGGAPPASSNCTVNVNVTDVVWYVRDVVDANNAAGGDGRSTNAFETLAAAASPVSGAGHYIYVFEGNTATTPQVGGISLVDGQKLWGQGIDLDIPSYPNLVIATNKARVRTTAASTNTVNVTTPGNRLNVEIRGLDLEATGATSNAVDVTSSGGNQIGVTISDDNIRGATAEGIDLNAGSNSAFTATVSNNTITSIGNGIDARVSGTGTMTVTAATDTITTTGGNSFDARTVAGATALRVALDNANVTASGNGIVVDGSAAGTTTITSFGNNAVNGNTGGTGISVTSATFDGTAGAPYNQIAGGTTVVGAAGATNGVGGSGVVLSNVAGDLLFTDLDVFAEGGAALRVTGTGAVNVAAGTGTRVAVSSGVSILEGTGGPAIDLSTLTADFQLSSLKSTSTTTGVSLTSLTDAANPTFNAVFSAPAGSTITTNAGATGPAFNVSGGNAQITYGGTITNNSTSARAVSVTTWGGDDATDDLLFSGAIDENGAGILVNGNTGSRAITFSGGLDIDTTTGEGFAATSNTNTLGLSITGSTNDISSTSATALRVTSTTIASSDLNFRNVSSGNNTAAADPASGIVLSSTGNLGGLKITGTGASGQGGNGTGGLIQNTTSHGVSLTTTREPSFSNLTIQNTGGSGIDGTDITDFTFDNGTITGSGPAGVAAVAVDTSNIALNDVSSGVNNVDGVVVITDSILNTAAFHGVDIYNESGTISSLTVTGNALTSETGNTAGTVHCQGSGIRVQANGSAGGASVITTATVSNNSVTNFPAGVGIMVQGGNAVLGPPAGLGDPTSGTNMITIANNAIAGSGATANVDALGSNAIQTAMTGTGNAKFFINANGTVGTPVRNFLGIGVSCSGGNLAVIECTVSNNVIDATANIASSSGMAVGSQLGVGQTGSITALIDGNNITGMEGNGILAGVTNSNNTGNFTIQNNTVGNPSGGVRPGIRVESGSASGDTTLCLNMLNNASGSSGGSAGLGIRKQGSVATTNDFGIVGLVPSPGTCGNAEDRVSSLNPGTNPGTVNTGSDCDGNPGSKTLAISGSNYVSCSVVLP